MNQTAVEAQADNCGQSDNFSEWSMWNIPHCFAKNSLGGLGEQLLCLSLTELFYHFLLFVNDNPLQSWPFS